MFIIDYSRSELHRSLLFIHVHELAVQWSVDEIVTKWNTNE